MIIFSWHPGLRCTRDGHRRKRGGGQKSPVCLECEGDADWDGRGWRLFPCAHSVCASCDASLDRCPLCRVDRAGNSEADQETRGSTFLGAVVMVDGAGSHVGRVDTMAIDGPAAVLNVYDSRVRGMLASGDAGVLITRGDRGGRAQLQLQIESVVNRLLSMRQRARAGPPPPPPLPPPPPPPPPAAPPQGGRAARTRRRVQRFSPLDRR